MNHSRYDTLFEDYLCNIVLTKGQADGIDRMIEETLSLFVREYEGDVEVYSQGSYAMGTTVRPLTAEQSPNGKAGEYDVDMVLERASWEGAADSLKDVRGVLSQEYADKLDAKLHESCERVLHSTEVSTDVSFHVDYVPIRPAITGRQVARRSPNRWSDSDTKELVVWFQDLADSNTFMPATILILKRMRDAAGLTGVLSSICITALVTALYRNTDSYGGDLISVLKGMINVFNVPYEQLSITIEPLDDDLADKIDQDAHAMILEFLKRSLDDLVAGFNAQDTSLIRSVLSSSFPAKISDYPEYLESLRNRNWGIETDGSLKRADVQELKARGREMTKRWRKFVGAGEKLEFRANRYPHEEYGIRWQVLNAADSPDVRGDLFEAHSPGGKKNSDEYVNHETEKYDGVHWIKYYVYSKSTKKVVEVGKRFFVEVQS